MLKKAEGGITMKTLEISTVRPHLEINSTRARIDITNRVRRFSAKRVAPKMNVEQKAASFKVDWSSVWAQSGRRSPSQLSNYMVQNSRAKVEQAISRIVSNGDYVKHVEAYRGSAGNPIGELAWQNYMEDTSVETNVGLMPETSPNIEWDPGYIHINWTTGEVQIEWDDNFRPDIEFTPHSVEIRLSAHPEVKIQVKERHIPGLQGKKVNHKA